MSDEIVFDRRKGFVALPVEVLELELSPGAFRLLVELCRMANLDGFCWPSLGQLGARLGRSKAAVSGYVQSLRDAGLISTEEQRTANGYNYRLRYCVRFWKDWRASLTGKTGSLRGDQKTESRVRQNERLRKLENQKPINHEQGVRTDLENLIDAWSAIAKGAPYPALRDAPTPDLLAETLAALKAELSFPADMSADIRQKLDELWRTLSLDADEAARRSAADHIATKGPTKPELDRIVALIEAKWQAHWRKVPNAKQLDQMLKSAGFVPRCVQISLLKSFMQRWERTQKSLPRDWSCERLPITAVPIPSAATNTYIRGYS